jgi:outer membrane protein assembly factor BamB
MNLRAMDSFRRLRPAVATWLCPVLVGCCAISCSCSQNEGGTMADGSVSGLSPCIADWPSAGRAPQARASLDVGSPMIVWSRKVPSTAFFEPGYLFDNVGLVVSKGNLVLGAHGPLVLVDKNGDYRQCEPTYSRGDMASPATVDQDGNLYSVALSGVYSFDPSGKIRWRLATSNETGGEFMVFYPPGLSPDGVLYAVCADGYLRAIGTSDGKEIWRQPANVRTGPSQVMGGAGRAVFMLSGTEGVHAYDSRTGQHLGEFHSKGNGPLFAFRGMWALGWDFGIQFGALYSFDTCGRPKWSTLVDSRYNDLSGVISLGETLVATKWDVDGKGNRLSPDRMYRYAADGKVVQGPIAGQGEPYLAGADGTIYTVNCASSSPKANELIAYSTDLREIWRLDLGVSNNCPAGNGVLDDDGVLYLVRGHKEEWAVEILAIQTQSPGLAESSWPSLRHDNRGTMWLTPLPPLSGSNPGVDTSVPAAVDASMDMSIAPNPAMDSSVPATVDTSIDVLLDRPGQMAE